MESHLRQIIHGISGHFVAEEEEAMAAALAMAVAAKTKLWSATKNGGQVG